MKVIPYIEIDGVKTLSNSEIMSLYDLMERDKSLVWMGLQNRDEWFHECQSGQLFVVVEDKKPIGFGILNEIFEKLAFVHFCVFAEAWGRGVEVTQLLVKKVLEIGLWDTLLGIIPTVNKRAVKMIEKNGFTIACTLPGVAWHKGKLVEGVLSYRRREDG